VLSMNAFFHYRAPSVKLESSSCVLSKFV